MNKIATLIAEATVNEALRAFTDVEIAAEQSSRFKVPGSKERQFLPVGDRITADDIAEFVGNMLSLRSPHDDIQNASEWLRSYMTSPNFSPDHSITLKDSRLRVHISTYGARQLPNLSIRRQPAVIPSLEELGVFRAAPQLRKDFFVNLPPSFNLITGPTGSGKSTSCASFLNLYSATHPGKILTLEDPIEYEIPSQVGVVVSRQVSDYQAMLGSDRGLTPTFKQALIDAKRETPDILFVSEVRSPELLLMLLNMSVSVPVYTTIHASSVSSALAAMIGWFNAAEQPNVRMLLANQLRFIQAQRLLPHANGKEWVLATEYCIPDPSMRSMISGRDIETGGSFHPDRFDQALSRASANKSGALMLNDCLMSLLQRNIVTEFAAEHASSDKVKLLEAMALAARR